MVAILPFNNRLSISKEEIHNVTGLSDKDLQCILTNFVALNVLTFSSETKTYNINEKFENKKLKLKMPHNPGVEYITEDKVAAVKAIDDDRRFYLQASVVRIMKSKKMMTHATLVEETINSARKRFNPSIPMIKGCIESLIEKGYMERKESAKNYYLYIQ